MGYKAYMFIVYQFHLLYLNHNWYHEDVATCSGKWRGLGSTKTRNMWFLSVKTAPCESVDINWSPMDTSLQKFRSLERSGKYPSEPHTISFHPAFTRLMKYSGTWFAGGSKTIPRSVNPQLIQPKSCFYKKNIQSFTDLKYPQLSQNKRNYILYVLPTRWRQWGLSKFSTAACGEARLRPRIHRGSRIAGKLNCFNWV